mgnify:FL=1
MTAWTPESWAAHLARCEHAGRYDRRDLLVSTVVLDTWDRPDAHEAHRYVEGWWGAKLLDLHARAG